MAKSIKTPTKKPAPSKPTKPIRDYNSPRTMYAVKKGTKRG